MRWDLFCKVIDNHGDVGVCWRVAAELGARGESVRLWIDDASALSWMAPDGAPGVEVVSWADPVPDAEPGDVVVEAFGCDPPPAFVARMARRATPPCWLNLEYLSAEPYVERSHGLPSPVLHGPGAGLTKHFFYPGFTPRTGGLLREQDLASRRGAFDRAGWRAGHGIPPDAQAMSLFCYEPPLLGQLLGELAEAEHPTHLLVTAGRAAAELAEAEHPTHLLVTAGRAAAAVRALRAGNHGALHLHFLPLMSQRAYDELLWACDFNFVRGEDSVVRGLLAGVPCAWHIYPQHDGAHEVKLRAFLGWLQPPDDLRDFFLAWNGLAPGPLPPLRPQAWQPAATAALTRINALPELSAGLERFAAGRARI